MPDHHPSPRRGRTALAALARWALCLAFAATAAAQAAGRPDTPEERAASARHTYYTGGVHNDKGCKPPSKCVYERKAGEPSDPQFPKWWSSRWTMYRVFNNYQQFPPPYASPPAGLTPADYQVSYGATYYDSTYVPADRDGRGAMMEFYEEFCLPIFPMANNFTCAFISLGNKAYFLRWASKPASVVPAKGDELPDCCQFSLHNHPPRRDFIKHLPYSEARSTHLDGTIQAYAREVGEQKILFGYSFWKEATADDPKDPKSPKYRHPQSFYFSGYPLDPPNAPIVSQNYTDFRAARPDARQTWDLVGKACKPNPGWCCLFASDCPKPAEALNASSAAPMSRPAPAPEWSQLDVPATPAK